MDFLQCAVMNDFNQNVDWYRHLPDKKRTIFSIFKNLLISGNRKNQSVQATAMDKTLCKHPI